MWVVTQPPTRAIGWGRVPDTVSVGNIRAGLAVAPFASAFGVGAGVAAKLFTAGAADVVALAAWLPAPPELHADIKVIAPTAARFIEIRIVILLWNPATLQHSAQCCRSEVSPFFAQVCPQWVEIGRSRSSECRAIYAQ